MENALCNPPIPLPQNQDPTPLPPETQLPQNQDFQSPLNGDYTCAIGGTPASLSSTYSTPDSLPPDSGGFTPIGKQLRSHILTFPLCQYLGINGQGHQLVYDPWTLAGHLSFCNMLPNMRTDSPGVSGQTMTIFCPLSFGKILTHS